VTTGAPAGVPATGGPSGHAGRVTSWPAWRSSCAASPGG
jgi:hypothetical protein